MKTAPAGKTELSSERGAGVRMLVGRVRMADWCGQTGFPRHSLPPRARVAHDSVRNEMSTWFRRIPASARPCSFPQRRRGFPLR